MKRKVVSLDVDVHAALRQECDEQRRSINNTLRELLARHFRPPQEPPDDTESLDVKLGVIKQEPPPVCSYCGQEKGYNDYGADVCKNPECDGPPL